MSGPRAIDGPEAPASIHNVIAAQRGEAPTADEVFDAFEQGKFDDPEAAIGKGAQLSAALQEGVMNWARERAEALRAAGRRATWADRRDMRGRTFAERDRQGFIGRYNGSCRVTPQMLDAELAPITDPDPDLEV
jgi:hypothetical protein